ncbi:hypothetical protein HZ326_1387 [Fusarium oxysporum f. sp. albedinis]|nr:hypothetical protein HZ326_1387 [Fusarium oxysporum f. sp. albedinis]
MKSALTNGSQPHDESRLIDARKLARSGLVEAGVESGVTLSTQWVSPRGYFPVESNHDTIVMFVNFPRLFAPLALLDSSIMSEENSIKTYDRRRAEKMDPSKLPLQGLISIQHLT